MKGKQKSVAVLIEELYQELEVWYPYYRLKEEGIEAVLVAPQKGKTYGSKKGYPAKAEMSAGEALKKKWDGVVIPGGYAPDYMRRHPPMIELVKKIYNGGGVVASICHGGWIIASAGIVKGKKVTSFFAIKDDLVNAGGEYIDEEVVVDGNLITSRKPDDLPAFMREILKKLK